MSKNQQYAERYAAEAMEQMKRYGIPASVTLAQGILESRNGQSELSQLGNNHFGVKASKSWLKNGGDYLVYTDDKPNEKFCKYATVGDSYEHHSKILKNSSRYSQCFKLSPDDYKGWTKGIERGGYATNGGYAASLQKIIEINGEFITSCDNFSEDIDIAISEAWTLSGNQLKMLIKKTAKSMTEGLQEMDMPGFTSKGSHYHKAYYSYPRAIDTLQVGAIKAGQLLVEINSFANPYPFQKCRLQSFLTEFLQKTGNENLIEEYDMQPFEVNVLDRRRTLTEKLVSLLRCSLADNYMPELTAKIRHFYDLHFLLNDAETQDYLKSDAFKSDFSNLFAQDQQRFDKPEGWQNKDIMDSPIISDLHNVWSALSNVYTKELPDLAYKDIPTIESIENSMEQLILYLIK